MVFLRHSALVAVGVQVPLGRCITADPHVPAPLYTEAELEGSAQLGVRQGDIWACKRDAGSRFGSPDFGGWPLKTSLMRLRLL